MTRKLSEQRILEKRNRVKNPILDAMEEKRIARTLTGEIAGVQRVYLPEDVRDGAKRYKLETKNANALPLIYTDLIRIALRAESARLGIQLLREEVKP